MGSLNRENLPEVFRPTDPSDQSWASRAEQSGVIRRLARGLYSTNLDEDPAQLIRRRWHDVAALYYPGSAIVDRSAALGRPAADGSLFLDIGGDRVAPRATELPGLTLRPRRGPGALPTDTPFAALFIASEARMLLDNLRPSRARNTVRRTLTRDELEERLDRIAALRDAAALNELRDAARTIAPALDASSELLALDRLIGALLGTRDAPLASAAAQARGRGLPFDRDRLALFETLRAELAAEPAPKRPAPPDPWRQLAFYEAYLSNWIEGTQFEVAEAQEIVFDGVVPSDRPDDAHDVLGTFEAVNDPQVRGQPPTTADALEAFVRRAHQLVMAGRPSVGPGQFKDRPNRAGTTTFVAPSLVRGTLREGFTALSTLPAGLPRATYAAFLIAEIHPFNDGNGRAARLLMNAELTAAGETRVLIPLVFRDEYLAALRALTHNANPTPLRKTIDRAQRWVASIDWADREELPHALERTNALVTPDDAAARNVHLRDDA